MRIQFGPVLAKGASERKVQGHLRRSYQSCKTHKLNNDESTNSIKDTASLPQAVIEELGHGLGECAGKDLGRVSHTEAKHNVEEETSEIREKHGK
jgi:hypothetical protein